MLLYFLKHKQKRLDNQFLEQPLFHAVLHFQLVSLYSSAFFVSQTKVNFSLLIQIRSNEIIRNYFTQNKSRANLRI